MNSNSLSNEHTTTLLLAEIDTFGHREFSASHGLVARIGRKNPKDGNFDPWESKAWLDRTSVLEEK